MLLIVLALAVLLLLRRHQARPAELVLRNLPTEQALSMRSFYDNTPSIIVFSNLTPQDIQLVWLDYQGRRQPRAIIPAQTSYTQATYAMNPWLCLDGNSNPVALFLAQPGKCVANIK